MKRILLTGFVGLLVVQNVNVKTSETIQKYYSRGPITQLVFEMNGVPVSLVKRIKNIDSASLNAQVATNVSNLIAALNAGDVVTFSSGFGISFDGEKDPKGKYFLGVFNPAWSTTQWYPIIRSADLTGPCFLKIPVPGQEPISIAMPVVSATEPESPLISVQVVVLKQANTFPTVDARMSNDSSTQLSEYFDKITSVVIENTTGTSIPVSDSVVAQINCVFRCLSQFNQMASINVATSGSNLVMKFPYCLAPSWQSYKVSPLSAYPFGPQSCFWTNNVEACPPYGAGSLALAPINNISFSGGGNTPGASLLINGVRVFENIMSNPNLTVTV